MDAVSIPSPTDAGPLITDEDVLGRVSALVQRAHRRQFWFMFLDAEDRQLPVLPMMGVRARPDDLTARHLPDHLCMSMNETGAEQLIVVYERPGRAQLTVSDREWLRLVAAGCEVHEIVLRGPLLAYTHGVRWIAPEDLR